MKDRIDEYHRRNPTSPSMTTLLHTINNQHTYQAPEEPTSESIIRAAYQLSKQERIAILEAELFNLRVKKLAPTSAIQTRAQKAKAPDVADVGEDIVPNKAKTTSRIEEIVDEEIPTQETLAPAEQSTILPEHPYRNARDAAYSVAMAIADVFPKNGYIIPNKNAKILKIFERLKTLKSWWVISRH